MSAQSITITRVTNNDAVSRLDVVAIEEPFEIRIVTQTEGKREEQSLSVTMRTPGHDAELARGFLFTEGIIQQSSDIESVTMPGGPDSNSVTVVLTNDLRIDRDKMQRNFYTTSSCGVCGKYSLDAVRVSIKHRDASVLKVSAKVIQQLPQVLRQHQVVFEQTGGLHASALFNSKGELLIVREDVGRHNALDKVIGAVMTGSTINFSDAVLLVSGRLSFELVQKAAVAGIPVVAAIGAPSSLAVSLATESGITLAGFVRDNQFNIYTGLERII